MACKIEPHWREKCRFGERLADFTTWRLGGVAEVIFEPTSRSDLSMFLARLDSCMPVWWLGNGSNVLIRDGGLKGVVIRTVAGLNTIERTDEGMVWADAGVRLRDLVLWSHQEQWVGLEFLAGIPGSVGGATVMNAGAHGHSLWDYITAVELIDRGGKLTWFNADQFEVGYRAVEIPKEHWVARVEFKLSPGEMDAARMQMDKWNGVRKQRQPLEWSNCGSVFKNPPGDYAGRLIESAGLKGVREGAVEVAEKNANFFINRGGATAADAERLIEKVRSLVFKRMGVLLEMEVIILGNAIKEEQI